ncbi:glycosyltransferase family 4 protein [Patescibacteria group bacterium]|nr:glycosyltransferase family 4 protein [Patescibacteria group bacterium]
MIIGIDISSTQYGTGVSDYTLNLVKNLIKIDHKNTYKLFFASLRHDPPQFPSQNNLELYHFHLPLNVFEILFNRFHLPIELFIGQCDIFHSSDWTQPSALKTKIVTTVHDLTPFINPSWHHPKVVSVHHRKMKLATRFCSHFICVSQNTQADLLRLFPQIDPQKTSVIYEAAPEEYRQFRLLTQTQKTKIKSQIKTKYHLDQFLLAQGTREPRKNLDRLIKAFASYKKSHPQSKLQLAITGKYGWGQDISKNPHPDIKILGFVPNTDLLPLHATSYALIYPSLYEGFGLPVLKSLSLGTPVITSSTSSLPEVAGLAALYINPLSVKSIALAIQKIVSSPQAYAKLSQSAILQAEKFSWTNTAKETLEIYKNL